MRLPLTYALGNLRRRPWRTAMTIVGIGFIIFASTLMMALSRGLFSRLDITGEPENILVISRKGQNIMFSSVPEDEITYLWSMPGVSTSQEGKVLVSPEIMHVSFVAVQDGDRLVRAPVSVRGVQPIGYTVHRGVRVVDGSLPKNEFEIMAGATAYIKLGVRPQALAVGKTLKFEGRQWRICGRFAASGSMIESELWTNEHDLQTVLRRRSHTFVVVRMQTPQAALSAMDNFKRSGALERFFKGWSEPAYYQEFTRSLRWVFWLSLLMVVATTLAGAMIGINTMYTAIISRLHEIGTLRVLGFSRKDILLSLVTESLVLSLAAGVLGIGCSTFANNLPMRLSQGAFFLRADAVVITAGIGLALAIGVIGVIMSAAKGLSMSIIGALRHE